MGNTVAINNFLSVQRDMEEILDRCFGNQTLLKLLYYNTPECLEKPDITDSKILKEISRDNIKIFQEITVPEKANSMIIITFDDFYPNERNPQFIDNTISFDIFCPNNRESMILDDYMLRPFRIMHEINSMMDKTKLTGIGTVHLLGASSVNLNSYFGYKITYKVINNV